MFRENFIVENVVTVEIRMIRLEFNCFGSQFRRKTLIARFEEVEQRRAFDLLKPAREHSCSIACILK